MAGQGGQHRHLPTVFSYRQGRGPRADTHPLFSVTDRVGQGRAARADTRPLFSITDRAEQDRRILGKFFFF